MIQCNDFNPTILLFILQINNNNVKQIHLRRCYEVKYSKFKKNFSDKEVLRDASYEFENGKIYGLLGRNGAGKTTLFNILYSELEKDDGDIKFFDDEALRNLKVEDIGMVFAETHLPDFLTAYEYIKFIIDINNPNELFKIDTYFDEIGIELEGDRHRL